MKRKIVRIIRSIFDRDGISPFWKAVDRKTKITTCAEELKKIEELIDSQENLKRDDFLNLFQLAKKQQQLLEEK